MDDEINLTEKELRRIVNDSIQEELKTHLLMLNHSIPTGGVESIKDDILFLQERLKYNFEDVYPATVKLENYIEFEDEDGIIYVEKGIQESDFISLVLYNIDKGGNFNYDASQGKILCTYVNLFLSYFLPVNTKFIIKSNDLIHFNIFYLVLSELIDKQKWNISKFQNMIIITKK